MTEEVSLTECIEEAIEVLKEAMGKLDLGFSFCSSCGARRFTNFSDKRKGDTLSGSITKLEGLLTSQKAGG